MCFTSASGSVGRQCDEIISVVMEDHGQLDDIHIHANWIMGATVTGLRVARRTVRRGSSERLHEMPQLSPAARSRSEAI
jgi:hypothetical protein